jgi:hypothetical protein
MPITQETPMTTDQRLARLERENRWMKVAGVLLLSALGSCQFLRTEENQKKLETTDEIRAKRVILVADTGEARIIIGEQLSLPGSQRSKEFGIRMFGSHGNHIAVLPDNDGGPSIRVSSKSGSVLLRSDEYASEISIMDKTGNGASLALDDDGVGCVSVARKERNQFIALVGPNPDPGPGLFLLEGDLSDKIENLADEKVKIRTALKLDKDGKAVLESGRR